MFRELDAGISVSEIRKCVQSLKNGKSCGPDKLNMPPPCAALIPRKI